MCWNAEVSLNTFVFSTFVLILVYYNNEYTKYKIPIFDNKWLYVLLVLAYSIQLIEHFLWKNMTNKYNSILTIAACILLFFQPLASLMLLTNYGLRNILITIYILVGVPYMLYTILNKKFRSTVSPGGNLKWNMPMPESAAWTWLFVFLFSFIYEQKWFFVLFLIITLTIFIYKEITTSGSMWCWVFNSISIYFAAYLLFYLPFCENRTVC
jgi:hypothetical protein